MTTGTGRTPSIRSALTTRLLIGLLLLSAATGLLTWFIAREALTRQFDAALVAKARGLAAIVQKEDDGEYEFEYAGEAMPEFELRAPSSTPSYFQIWLPDNTVLKRSPSLNRRDIERFGTGQPSPEFRDVILPDGGAGRGVTMSFVPYDEDAPARPAGPGTMPGNEKEAATVVVLQSRAPLDRVLSTLAGVLAVGCLLLIPGFGTLLVVWTVRRELKPLDRLAARVQQLGPANLQGRLDAAGLPAELRPVPEKMNALLDRLESAFERERRFTSDVSHELRTPLTEARIAVELAQRWPEDAGLHSKACSDALDSLVHMQNLIAKLLLLVRPEADKAAALRLEPENLAEATRAVLDSGLAQTARQRGLELVLEPGPQEPPVTVRTDAVLLTSILRNLIENAVEYTPPSGRVVIRISERSGKSMWSIDNDAPELNPDDVSQMFEPFWRKDASRTGDSHSGLGLSLASSFSQLLGITISRALRPDGRLQVDLHFPGL